ncbi:MAG: ATP-binding protein [Candidatus Dependentiae bacterium]|nr:ATP-binding protein [Candidatus Dependentiae bacterium]
MLNAQKIFIIFLISNAVIFSAGAINPTSHDFLQKAEEKTFKNDGQKIDISLLPDTEKESLKKLTDEEAVAAKPSEKPIQEKNSSNQEAIREMEYIFMRSPVDAQNIVRHLKDPSLFDEHSYRYAIFVGPPGSGKTKMAKAIAYKMQQEGWKVEYIVSGAILSEKRNETAVKLRNKLEALMAKKQPVIVIIDELNELLENTESEHHDTSATAKFLWQFLDSQEENQKFFLIGTMNRDTKLPQPFKDRIMMKRIQFESIADINQRYEIFRDKLSHAKIKLENDIDGEYLKNLVKRLPDCTGRDIREFVFAIKKVYRRYDNANPIIAGKKHLDAAINEYIKARIDIEYSKVEETDAERQERHFVQRAMMDILMQNCIETYQSGGLLSPEKTQQRIEEKCMGDLILGVFSDDQLRSIRKMGEDLKKRLKLKEEIDKQAKNKEKNG